MILDAIRHTTKPKALFVYIGLHPESFRLIKVYIN
jgi:hypothetical protein